MSLNLWVPDEIIPATKLNEPVNLLNEIADSGLSWSAMFRRSHLQKLAVSSPQDGYFLFNTASGKPQIFINGRWYEFELSRADFDISGTVTNTLSSDPIPGVAVTVNGNQVTATDENGAYAVSDVPKGAAVAIAGTLAGYNTYNDTVNIAAGDAVKDFTMARRTLFGNITSSAGGVISSAAVSISGPTRNDTSDGAGDYALIDVPDGSYTVSATHPDHQAYSSPVPVVVDGDTEFDFVMQILTGTVSGTITSSVTSQPVIAGLPVIVAGMAAANTNGSGVYSRSDVPRLAGQSVTVAASTYYNSYSGTVDVNGANVTKNITISPKTLDYRLNNGNFPSLTTSAYGFSQFLPSGQTHGNRFYCVKTCRIIGLSGFTVATGQTSIGILYTMKLWSDAGTLLGTATATNIYDGWAYGAFSSPVTINAGSYYRVSVYAASGSRVMARQSSLYTTFGLSTTHPIIRFVPGPSNGDYGYYAVGDAFPNSNATGWDGKDFYGIDVRFQL